MADEKESVAASTPAFSTVMDWQDQGQIQPRLKIASMMKAVLHKVAALSTNAEIGQFHET